MNHLWELSSLLGLDSLSDLDDEDVGVVFGDVLQPVFLDLDLIIPVGLKDLLLGLLLLLHEGGGLIGGK